ncbi:DUF4129 domain-containing protein [Halobaculum sp. MBLA0143]|uniref:DUF4129 domain-containing protein n=1 Tax=Halobaculum sp. MBLA0143 TaxID=3079933 RepID=UPI003524C0AA
MVDRRTALSVLLAVAAVAALSLSAATLTSTTRTSSDGVGAGTQSGQTGLGTGPDSGVDITESSGGESPEICVEELRTLPAQLLGLAVIVAGFLLLYRQMGSVVLSALAVMSLSFPFLFIWGLLISCGTTQSSPSEQEYGLGDTNQTGLLSGGGSSGLGGTGEAVSTPTAILGVLLVLAIAGSAVLLIRSAAQEQDEADEDGETTSASRQAAVGQVAGAAADRLEADANVDNEVYRAWREMTTHLDVDRPRSSTPAEFAAAAVEAGIDREDATELTALFEEVRYGGEEVTDDRERRAVAALRNVEAVYADEDDDGGDTA